MSTVMDLELFGAMKTDSYSEWRDSFKITEHCVLFLGRRVLTGTSHKPMSSLKQYMYIKKEELNFQEKSLDSCLQLILNRKEIDEQFADFNLNGKRRNTISFYQPS